MNAEFEVLSDNAKLIQITVIGRKKVPVSLMGLLFRCFAAL